MLGCFFFDISQIFEMLKNNVFIDCCWKVLEKSLILCRMDPLYSCIVVMAGIGTIPILPPY